MILGLINNRPIVGAQEGTRLTIFGDINSISSLKSYHDIKQLYIINIKQYEFDYLVENYPSSFEFIYFYNMQVSNLSRLSLLKNIQFLALQWNNKATRLWNVAENSNLVELYISDFPKLESLDGIENSNSITNLELSGGMQNPLMVESLQPLSKLEQLKSLSLLNIKVRKEGLRPISALINLVELELPNMFPTKEYAMLSVTLKDTKCKCFAPYIKLEQKIGGKDIMVIGKGKPLLNSTFDKSIMTKYSQEFRCMQQEFE